MRTGNAADPLRILLGIFMMMSKYWKHLVGIWGIVYPVWFPLPRFCGGGRTVKAFKHLKTSNNFKTICLNNGPTIFIGDWIVPIGTLPAPPPLEGSTGAL